MKWLMQVLEANESRALDSEADREAVAKALAVNIQLDRDRLVTQISTWLHERGYDELAVMIKRGEWT